MAFTATFLADFKRFEASIQQATVELSTFDRATKNATRSLRREVESFSGQKLAVEAGRMVEAITRLGEGAGVAAGAMRLTTAEQQRVNTVMTEALEKFKAMGQEPPAAMRELAEATKQVPKPTEDAALSVGKLVGALITAEAVIGTVKTVWSSYVALIKGSIESFTAAEAADRKLQAALVAQGTATPTVISQYKALADQFQKTTVFSDELIVEMQALLTQVGNVMPAQMETALKAATNLASGLGIDLRTATMLVGKAFEGETGTLKRYGIVIDEAKLKAEGVTAVLDAVQQRFGGQAQAEVDSYGGQIKQLANAWDNLKERIGEFAASNRDTQTILRALNQIIQDITDDSGPATTALGKLWDVWQRYIEIGQTITPGVAQFWRWLRDVADQAAKTVKPITDVADALDRAKKSMAAMTASRAAGPLGRTDAAAMGVIEQELTREAWRKIHQTQEEAARATERATSALRSGSSAMKTAANDSARLAEAQVKAAAAIREFGRDASGSFGVELMLASGALGKLTTELSASEQAFDRTNAAIREFGRDASGAFGVELMLASGALGKMTTELQDLTPTLKKADTETKTWRESLRNVATAFSQMAQVADGALGSVFSGIGRVITAINTMVESVDSIRSGWKQMGSGGGFLSSLGGFASVAGGVLGIVGSIGGLISGWFGVSEAVKQARQELVQFQEKLRATLTTEQRRGLRDWEQDLVAVRDAYINLGFSVEDAIAQSDELVAAIWDTDHPDRMRDAIAQVNDILKQSEERTRELAEAQAELTRLQEEAKYTFREMQEDAELLGVNFANLGPIFQQAKIDETSQKYVNAIDRLIQASNNPGLILTESATALSELVQQALKFGTTLPENMRIWLEELAKSGQLVDENGDAITDLSQLKFGERIKTEAEIIADAMERLEKIINRVADALISIRMPQIDLPGVPDSWEPATIPGTQPSTLPASASKSLVMAGGGVVSAPLQIIMNHKVIADAVIEVAGSRFALKAGR